MDVDKATNITFGIDTVPKAKILAVAGTATYTSLAAAYSAAITGDTIMTIGAEMPDNGITVSYTHLTLPTNREV